MGISRRSMLKGGLMASASLPFLNIGGVVDQWRTDDVALEEMAKGNEIVKLNSNENPYGPSEKARQAIIEAISAGNRYPRPAISKLQKQIAEYEKVSPDQVMISAGSTELLGLFGLMAGVHKGQVVGCDPTFDFMLYFAEKFSAERIKVPLTSDHQYNLEGIDAAVSDRTNLVFVCNPNNPTGAELPAADLHPFCQELSKRTMVYVDEAYMEFSKYGRDSSMANMTRTNKNLVVGRTFSKVYGLAGLRVGYAIGHPDTIKKARDLMQGRMITPSVTSIAAASASLGDEEFIKHCIAKNEEAKQVVYAAFDEQGIEYIPSSTNFVLFKTDRFGDLDVRKELQRKDVLIRDYSNVPGWARVSIGTPDEMRVFSKATKKLVV